VIRILAGRFGALLRGLTFAALLLAGACGVQEGIPGYPGQPAPEFSAPDLNGDTVSLASLRGDVVLLNLWATWCPPCRVEMPHLQALHDELADRGLRVVGVSVDSEGSSGTVVRFLDDLDIDFLILRDPAEHVPHLYRTIGLPLSVLIDREGIIRWRHTGPVTSDDPRLRAVLDELLSDG
jgi:peroxiredoxin